MKQILIPSNGQVSMTLEVPTIYRARLLTVIDTRFIFLLIIYEWSHEYERISKDEWGVKFVFSLKYQQMVITPKNEF